MPNNDISIITFGSSVPNVCVCLFLREFLYVPYVCRGGPTHRPNNKKQK